MSPQRKPLFQRLKAMLAGVCARFRRKPAEATPQPARTKSPKPEPSPAEQDAAIAAAIATLEALFQAWCAGTLPQQIAAKRKRARRALRRTLRHAAARPRPSAPRPRPQAQIPLKSPESPRPSPAARAPPPRKPGLSTPQTRAYFIPLS